MESTTIKAGGALNGARFPVGMIVCMGNFIAIFGGLSLGDALGTEGVGARDVELFLLMAGITITFGLLVWYMLRSSK